MLLQAVPQLAAFCAGRVAFRHDHDVDGRKIGLMQAKGFACLPLDPVANDGGRRRLARDSQPQPGMVQPVRGRKQGKKPVGRTLAFTENASERFRFQQALVTRKPELIAGIGIRPYGQSRARPLARRALSTLRPPLVAMRARKPWVRLRRRLLGWYVLFMTAYLLLLSGAIEPVEPGYRACKKTRVSDDCRGQRKGGKITGQALVCQQKNTCYDDGSVAFQAVDNSCQRE